MTRDLLASLVLVAASSLPAGPASAHQVGDRTHPVRSTTTTTTPVGRTTTTTTTAIMPVPQAPTPGVTDGCIRRPWPAVVQGRPASFLTGADGAYLWADADGSWALQVTHSGARDRAIFAGTLTLPRGRFVDVHGTGNLGNDIVAVSPNGRVVLFRFVNFGQVDGLDFSTHCATAVKVNIHKAGALAPSTLVHLGAGEANPPANPFRVLRAPGGIALAAQDQPTVPGMTTTTTTMTAKPVAAPS